MFPSLENYNTEDIRQLILYTLHFDLFAIKEIIEITKENIDANISALIDIAKKNIDNPYIHTEAMTKVQEYHNIEPVSYQSYLLSLYSVVESSLDQYCEVCQSNINLKIGLEDLKDKGITRAINYLEKVVEVDNIKSDNRWAKMKLINELRNDFIHRAGYLKEIKKINKYKAELGIEVVDGKIYLLYEDIINIYTHIDEFIKFVFTRDLVNSSKQLKIRVDK